MSQDEKPFRLAGLLKMSRIKEQVLKDLMATLLTRRAEMCAAIDALVTERETSGAQAAAGVQNLGERELMQQYLRGLSSQISERLAALKGFDSRLEEVRQRLVQAGQDRSLLDKLEKRGQLAAEARQDLLLQDEMDGIAARLAQVASH